jgi:hypothetical protein
MREVMVNYNISKSRSLLGRIKEDDPVVQDADHWVAAVERREVRTKDSLANQAVEDLSNRVLGEIEAVDFVVGIKTGEGCAEDTSGLDNCLDALLLADLHS